MSSQKITKESIAQIDEARREKARQRLAAIDAPDWIESNAAAEKEPKVRQDPRSLSYNLEKLTSDIDAKLPYFSSSCQYGGIKKSPPHLVAEHLMEAEYELERLEKLQAENQELGEILKACLQTAVGDELIARITNQLRIVKSVRAERDFDFEIIRQKKKVMELRLTARLYAEFPQEVSHGFTVGIYTAEYNHSKALEEVEEAAKELTAACELHADFEAKRNTSTEPTYGRREYLRTVAQVDAEFRGKADPSSRSNELRSLRVLACGAMGGLANSWEYGTCPGLYAYHRHLSYSLSFLQLLRS